MTTYLALAVAVVAMLAALVRHLVQGGAKSKKLALKVSQVRDASALMVIDTASFRVVDARKVEWTELIKGNTFEVWAAILATLPSCSAHIWAFSDATLRVIAELDAIGGHLFATKLTRAEPQALKTLVYVPDAASTLRSPVERYVPVCHDVTIVGADSSAGIEEILRQAQAV